MPRSVDHNVRGIRFVFGRIVSCRSHEFAHIERRSPRHSRVQVDDHRVPARPEPEIADLRIVVHGSRGKAGEVDRRSSDVGRERFDIRDQLPARGNPADPVGITGHGELCAPPTEIVKSVNRGQQRRKVAQGCDVTTECVRSVERLTD